MIAKPAFALAAFIGMHAAGAAQPDYTVEAEAGTSLERLTSGRSDWRSDYVGVLGRNESRQSYYGRLRSTERFDQNDGEGTIGTYQPFGGAWGLQLEATASPTYHVLPKDSLLAQLERRFGGGWGVQAGYRRSTYEHTGTDLGIATVERYFGDYRAAYSLYLGRPDGTGFGASHRLQYGYYYAERSFVTVAAWAGKEAENVFPTGILVSRVHGASLNGRHRFSRDWAFTYELLTHAQGDLYTRRGIGIGLQRVF